MVRFTTTYAISAHRSYEERKSDKRAGRKNSESDARNNDE
jgi:hypothetical protein